MGPMLVADIATDYRPHLSAPDMGRYLGAYADHFGLRKNIEFGKSVERLERDEQNSRWILHFSNASDSPRSFDKVVWATGEFLRPKRIKLPGQEVFIGQILHSQDVRNLQDFAGKNVVVLGMGNTAADLRHWCVADPRNEKKKKTLCPFPAVGSLPRRLIGF